MSTATLPHPVHPGLLGRVFPRSLDNAYNGHPAAVWLLLAVVIMKTAIALGTIFNGRNAAQSADGIPLDRFGTDAAAAVVTLFAIWGLSQLVLSVFGVLALALYRAMIPLMFVLLVLEHITRKWILFLKPIERTGTASGFYINLTLLLVMSTGLALSLRSRPAATSEP